MIKILGLLMSDFNDRIFYVLNDLIGKELFDEISNILWRKYEENIKVCLNKIKFLMLCRKYILSNNKVKGFLKNVLNIVDIMNDYFKLSVEEKRNIWKMYVDENELEDDIMEVIKIEMYFFLLCKLYFSRKNKIYDKIGFFKVFIEVFEEEIRDFRKLSKDKYCVLVFFVLFNNELCVEDV